MKKLYAYSIAFIFIFVILIGIQTGNSQTRKKVKKMNTNETAKLDTATFGEGCFWCTEAIFQRLKGVVSVTAGYSGGTVPNPSYEQVCTGETGHAEVSQIVFDPREMSFVELLRVFWSTHDPTTLNRQGADVGTQYRSVIFYHNEAQKEAAEHYKKELDKSKVFDKPVVTQIEPFKVFYKAENYHQNYYNNNPNKPYCSLVITPKVEKFEKIFKNDLKANVKN